MQQHNPRVDLNHADEQTICDFTGLDQKSAHAIVEYRKAHGDFAGVQELTYVPQIDSSTIAFLRDKVSFEPFEPEREF
ncbi:MAG: ComEA family DNA-binding protein [Chitinivibrionales bacterium]